jgi:YrbI family 3-deoxy-D-manno-octulosonate 8-phosphate phosphatase
MFKLLVYDFDGVMTNNKVYVDQDGREIVQVNRGDGLAVSEIKKLNIGQVILSSEKNIVVLKRANKLKIDCIYGVESKKDVLIKYISDKMIKLDEVGYVGNDINDLDVMKIVGFRFCPQDAHHSIKNIADLIFTSTGGNGVIRELYDFIKENKEK